MDIQSAYEEFVSQIESGVPVLETVIAMLEELLDGASRGEVPQPTEPV